MSGGYRQCVCACVADIQYLYLCRIAPPRVRDGRVDDARAHEIYHQSHQHCRRPFLALPSRMRADSLAVDGHLWTLSMRHCLLPRKHTIPRIQLGETHKLSASATIKTVHCPMGPSYHVDSHNKQTSSTPYV